MRTTLTKDGRAWRWEVTEDGQTLAGGYCKTRHAAARDAGIGTEGEQATRARKAGRIVRGERVTILPEWQDKGDSNYHFTATETQLPGMTEIRIAAVRKSDGERVPGVQSIQTRMLVTP